MSERPYDADEVAQLLGIQRFPMLRPEEAAERMGMSREDLIRLVKERRITHLRLSRSLIRFDPVDIALHMDPLAVEKARVAQARTSVDERLSEASVWVYFIQMKRSKAVKIGIANDVDKRLLGLQTGNPDELRPICTISGDHRLESAFHLALKPWRLKGEWFAWNVPLAKAVERLNAGKHVVDVIVDLCAEADAIQEARAQ